MAFRFLDTYEEPVLVGEGAFGKVYRVKKRGTDAYYALKVIEQLAVWERECRFLEHAEHHLFPTFVEKGESDGCYYILMEYIWGEDLSALLSRRGPFSPPDAMRIALTIADGMAYLTQKDGTVLFRDLKAQNIRITPEGNVKLMDFGCACTLDEANASIAGTKGYAPQEQLSFAAQTGAYSDVYAFGMLFHYLLTGENPQQIKGRRKTLQEFDETASYALELLLQDCTREEANLRIPDMYIVLSRMLEIASNTAWGYRKLEKRCKKELKRRGQDAQIIYEKNIHG